MKLVWDERAWEDYPWWQAQDRTVLKRINALITDEHRLVGKTVGDEIRIAACRYHYG